MHLLCESAIKVPASVPAGKKYQPETVNGKDFSTGDALNGWWCLRFRVDQPIYYQYHYNKSNSVVAPNNPAKCTIPDCYEAGALGDLDADGTPSVFALTGAVTATRQLKVASALHIENEVE
jgi:type IV pilus assembly protein PilA